MTEIYPFTKLFFAKYFKFGNLPNSDPATKHSRYMVCTLQSTPKACIKYVQFIIYVAVKDQNEYND